MHSIERVKSILQDNNKQFTSPDAKKEFISNLIDGLDDFENLNSSIVVGWSEIVRDWNLQNGWTVRLCLTKSSYLIGFMQTSLMGDFRRRHPTNNY